MEGFPDVRGGLEILHHGLQGSFLGAGVSSEPTKDMFGPGGWRPSLRWACSDSRSAGRIGSVMGLGQLVAWIGCQPSTRTSAATDMSSKQMQ